MEDSMSRKLRHLSRLAVLAMATFSVALIQGPAFSKDGRDFTGFYELTEVQDLGLDATMTLAVRLFNLTGRHVSGATVTLQDSVLLGTTYATFAGSDIPENGSTVLTANVQVPRNEYDLWLAGGTPRIEIEYRNVDGKVVRRIVELSPKPAGGK